MKPKKEHIERALNVSVHPDLQQCKSIEELFNKIKAKGEGPTRELSCHKSGKAK